MKVIFEADLDGKLMDELKFWGLSLEDVVEDAMEHSIMGSVRRKTDNLCRNCKKPLESSIPASKRAAFKEYCACKPN